MTTITATAADVTMVNDNTSWTFFTQQIRESDDGTIITTKKVRKYPIAGVLTVTLDPGPAVVLAPDGKTYPFTVPGTDSLLWPLIQAAVTIPASTKHDELVAAVDAWLASHTDAWDVLPGRPAPLVAGANVANGYAGLDGSGKLGTAQLPISAMEYKGNWNASTNSPTLADGTGSAGDVYKVATGAARNLGSGSITFDVGDYVIYNGTVWEKSDNTDAVTSVAGLAGVITAAGLKTALAMSVSVKDYGAVGDGTTNDTTAFQNALNAVASIKGTVFIPDGTYKIASTLTLPPGVSMVGASTRGAVIKTTTDITAIKCSSGENETLRDFTIRGSTFVGTRTTYDIWFVNPVHPVIDGVKVDLDNTRAKGGICFTRDNGLPDPYAFMPVVRNCWLRNAHLVSDNVTDGKIEGCWIWAAGGTPAALGAVQLVNTSNGWTLTGNDYVPPNDTGEYGALYISATEDITIVGGYVDGSYNGNTTQYGIVADNADGLTVSGFRMWNIGKSAIKATDTNRIAVTGSNFADNNKLDNSYPDIDLYNCHAVTVTGNTFHSGTARTNKGLIYREDGSSSGNVIASNALNTVGGHYYATSLVTAANSHVADTNQPEGSWPWRNSAGNLLQGRTPGDTYDRVRIEADGDIWLGSGSATADTRLVRVDANRLGTPGVLRMDDMLQIRRPSTTTDLAVGTFLNADAEYRMQIDIAGKHQWGNGTTLDTTLERLAAGVLGLGGVALRKVTPRVNAMSFSATPTFDLSAYDQFNMTLTAAITSATFSNGVDGQSYRFRFKDNATARAIALGSTARAVGITLPTTTVVSKVLYLVGIWNAADTIMDFVGVAQEA